MRYIITQSQLHKLIYNHLNQMFSKKDFRREINPYVKDEQTWLVKMFNDNGENMISYFWFGPGEDDDGNIHNGVGSVHIHADLVDPLRSMLNIRENKIMDIIADWVSETLNVDIDEISLYPNRKGPANY